MLVITVRPSEDVVLRIPGREDVRIGVVARHGGGIKMRIVADLEIRIHRENVRPDGVAMRRRGAPAAGSE